jgi:hypothetical protein
VRRSRDQKARATEAEACPCTDFDEIYLGQVGGNLEGAFEFFAAEVLPRARES